MSQPPARIAFKNPNLSFFLKVFERFSVFFKSFFPNNGKKKLKNGRKAALKTNDSGRKMQVKKKFKKTGGINFHIRVALFDKKNKKTKTKTKRFFLALRVLTLRKLRESSFFFLPKHSSLVTIM